MGAHFKDLTNLQSGRLTARWPVGTDKSYVRWLCSCSCGKLHFVDSSHLIRNAIRSCGCLRNESAKIRATKHGMSESPEYAAWCDMQRRCFNPRCDEYINYGGRGITVSKDWRGTGGFEKFFIEVGHRPSKVHSLDRIHNDGNYEPGNVKWATRNEQNDNRRLKRIENFTDDELMQEVIRRKLI
jgi:hypothetical protein